MKNGEQASRFGKQQNLQLSQAGIVLEYFRPRKQGREFRIILAKQEGKDGKAKRKGE